MIHLTINDLPKKKSMDALFLDHHEGSYELDISGQGVVLIPETRVVMEEGAGPFKGGDHLRVMRDDNVLAVRRLRW